MATEAFTPEGVELIGGRRFWVCREALSDDQILKAFAELEEQSDQDGDGPLGICLIVDAKALADRPQVVWPDSGMLHAGHDSEGRAHRIRYFDDAQVGPAMPGALTTQQMRDLVISLEDNYRVIPFAEAEGITNEDIIAFWEREQAVAGEEAQRRVHEVQMVGLEDSKGLAAVSTAFLQLNPQLGLHLWYYRGYVGRDHRQNSIATNFAIHGRDHLEERFTSGVDLRGAGVVFEIENDFLKTFLNRGQWLPSDFTFVGENQKGDHVRVHYFAGAELPSQA